MVHSDHENIARNVLGETEDEVFEKEGITRNMARRAYPTAVKEPSETLPPYIKIDFTIEEEISIPLGSVIAIIVAIVIIVATFESRRLYLIRNFLHYVITMLGADLSHVRFVCYIIIILSAAAIIISKAFIDNFYIINTAERKIFYRRKVFNWASLTPFLENTDIYAVSVLCWIHEIEKHHWYECESHYRYYYKVVIIKKDSLIVNFGDEQETDVAKINKQAHDIAAIMQCGYIECPDKHKLVTFKETNGDVRAYFIKTKEEKRANRR